MAPKLLSSYKSSSTSSLPVSSGKELTSSSASVVSAGTFRSSFRSGGESRDDNSYSLNKAKSQNRISSDASVHSKRFSSDASVNTHLLHDAIDDALDNASRISHKPYLPRSTISSNINSRSTQVGRNPMSSLQSVAESNGYANSSGLSVTSARDDPVHSSRSVVSTRTGSVVRDPPSSSQSIAGGRPDIAVRDPPSSNLSVVNRDPVVSSRSVMSRDPVPSNRSVMSRDPVPSNRSVISARPNSSGHNPVHSSQSANDHRVGSPAIDPISSSRSAFERAPRDLIPPSTVQDSNRDHPVQSKYDGEREPVAPDFDDVSPIRDYLDVNMGSSRPVSPLDERTISYNDYRSGQIPPQEDTKPNLPNMREEDKIANQPVYSPAPKDNRDRDLPPKPSSQNRIEHNDEVRLNTIGGGARSNTHDNGRRPRDDSRTRGSVYDNRDRTSVHGDGSRARGYDDRDRNAHYDDGRRPRDDSRARGSTYDNRDGSRTRGYDKDRNAPYDDGRRPRDDSRARGSTYDNRDRAYSYGDGSYARNYDDRDRNSSYGPRDDSRARDNRDRTSSYGDGSYARNHDDRDRNSSYDDKASYEHYQRNRKALQDTLMTLEIVNDGGNIKFKKTSAFDPMASSNTIFEFQPDQVNEFKEMAKKDKSPHPNGPSQPPRTGLPPIGRAPENAHKTNDDASQASDFSSITGFPRTTRTTFGARSVFTAKTTASRWKNNDVVLLPKDNLKSDASVAVAAAASLLVNGNEPANFEENAVQSVANMISSTEKINEDALIVVKPSQANKKFNDPMDDSVVPISFNKVKENLGGLMEEKEKEKERNNKSGNEDHNNDSDESKARITASEFYARCALLAASAIMKADPDDKAAIAQTAAETILSFHNSEMQANEDWLDSADENLREVADEVSNSIRVLSVPNSQAMASVASVAVVSEGGKALALERHRRRMDKAAKLEVVEVIDMHNDDKVKINSDDDEEDVINPIRNKGSLMDNMSDGDDDDDNEKTFTPVPSRGRGMSLSQHTQAQKSENSSNQKAHVQNAVRNLLESTSDDVPVETEVVDPSPRVRRSSQLDRKQQEITKRIQRIQMRAAGRTDEEIDAVLGNKKELSNPNMLPNAGQPPLGNKSRSRKNRMDDRSVFEDKDDIMDGINSVFTPVVSYLGKMAKTNLPSMPKCEGEEDDFGFDEYEGSRPHGMKNRNLVAAQNHDHGSNPNFNGTDIDVEQKLISPTSTLSADLGEFKFRDSQARETSKVPNQDQGAQSEQVPMGRVSTNDTGAFSAALNNGDFSSIPVQKLSTIPPVDDSLETTKNLFFSSAQEQGATDSYVNKEEKKEDTMSSTINVARGQSDVNGLLNELGESEKKSKKKGKKSRAKKMKKMFALGKKR